METTQKFHLSEEEIINQIDRTQKMVRIAANSIGKSFWDIEVEATYTRVIIRGIETWKRETSIDMLWKIILTEEKKYWAQYSSELQDFISNSDKNEAVDETIMKRAICFKELVWSKRYERFLSYYNSKWYHKEKRAKRWSVVYDNEYHKKYMERICIYNKKKKILKQISESPELQAVFA